MFSKYTRCLVWFFIGIEKQINFHQPIIHEILTFDIMLIANFNDILDYTQPFPRNLLQVATDFVVLVLREANHIN